jgi:hypothetical protein
LPSVLTAVAQSVGVKEPWGVRESRVKG